MGTARAAVERGGLRRRDDQSRAQLHAWWREQPEVGQAARGADDRGGRTSARAHCGQRERFTGEEHLVFTGAIGGHLDSNEVRDIYHKALADAGLRRLRFHDLRHTFGTLAVEPTESILELKEWMGHANVQTTMRYLHYKSKADAARRLSQAFVNDDTQQQTQTPTHVTDRRQGVGRIGP